MDDTSKKITTAVSNRALDIRRKMQYEALLQWDRGYYSARECIEKIIELEKLIYIDPQLLRSLKNGR